ncbi:MAG: ATP-binding cassette domain-containing protein [Candidatus Izemoplasmatales bacterium]
MSKAIVVSGLVKRYLEVEAVRKISFSVESGTLFAFLGPNGAGKSTTINIITTLLSFNEGEVHVNGYLVGKEDALIRDQIGIVFQDSVLDPYLSIRENLETRGSLYGTPKAELTLAIDEALEVTQIKDIQHRRYGKLSGGQRRRADIARALVHKPKILFLDEPTTGLDPQTRQSVWSTIQTLQKKTGMTVFLTTHYLEEADQADDVVILDNGQIVAQGTPSFIKDHYSHDLLELKPSDFEKVLSQIEGLDYQIKGDLITIPIENTMKSLEILPRVQDHIVSFQVKNGSLDDAFITITGKEMRS